MRGRCAAGVLAAVVALASACARAATPASTGASQVVVTAAASRVLVVMDGRISFQDEKLGVVLAEMNGRSRCKLELVDSAAGEMRVGGALSMADPHVTMRRLLAALNVRARIRDDAGMACARKSLSMEDAR